MSGDYMLVAIDEYSQVPEVKIILSSGKVVISCLTSILTVVKTDNRPPFQSGEFRDFGIQLRFRYSKTILCSSKANGEVKQFMRTMNKFM